MKLLTTQKNTLLEIILKSGLKPKEFEFNEWSDENNLIEGNTEITYYNTLYFFNIKKAKPFLDRLVGKNYTEKVFFSPNVDSISGENYVADFNQIQRNFYNWLQYLKRETGVVDRWSEYERNFSEIEFLDDNSEENFSDNEKLILANKLQNIKEELRETNILTDIQFKRFEEKLDYLIKQSNNKNKFDWKSLFIGTIFNLTIQTALEPESSVRLWGIIRDTFSNILKLN